MSAKVLLLPTKYEMIMVQYIKEAMNQSSKLIQKLKQRG